MNIPRKAVAFLMLAVSALAALSSTAASPEGSRSRAPYIGRAARRHLVPGKTLIFIIATIFGALVIIFLLLVFFSLLSDAFGYFASLYREIVFRLS